MASKREEGEKKSKHKKKVEKEREVMFHRAEDNETEWVKQKAARGSETGRSRDRCSRSRRREWRTERGGKAAFIRLSRQSRRIKKALEGVPSPKEDVQEFVVAMEAIKASYNLNGLECQQILMTAMGLDWHKVVGDWSPTEAGEILAHNDPALGPRYTAVLGRVTGRFQRRADYTEIGRVKQRDDEPFEDFRVRMEKVFWMHSGIVYDADQNGAYQQQLKNALHNGSLDRIQGWIRKHVVGLGTKTMNEFVDFALHADKVTKKNKNPKPRQSERSGKSVPQM